MGPLPHGGPTRALPLGPRPPGLAWSTRLPPPGGRRASMVDEAANGGEGREAPDAAFDARFQPHAEAVERLCRQLLGGGDAARDALHEVYLRARRGFATYDPARPLRTWLHAIAAHHCIDRLRREGREQRLFQPTPEDEAALAEPGPSPLARLLGAEQRARLARAVETLPPRYRAPIVLRYHAELSYEEIAARLGITRAEVGTLLFRGRRRLRERLAEEEGDR
jgi:RNA polymerase sigma-70 factor (ECF subfamily)